MANSDLGLLTLSTTPSIKYSLQWAVQQLQLGQDAQRDSELLLMHVLNKPHSYLLAWPDRCLTAALATQFSQLILARKQGTPAAYLLGEWASYQLTLSVTPDTLIPRADTDTLIAACLDRLPADLALRIVDLGTGSGSVALNLAHARVHWQVTATDISVAALQVAKYNAQHYHIRNVCFIVGDWLTPFAGQQFDVIVSNPPYISVDDPHLIALQHEPRQALVAADNGLAAIKQIITQALTYLRPQGWLFLEHGYLQAIAVRALLTQCGFSQIESINDLGQRARVTLAKR